MKKQYIFKQMFVLLLCLSTTAVFFNSCGDSGFWAKTVQTPVLTPEIYPGDQANPYIITTPEQLDAVRNNLSAYYKLGNDIDLRAYLASGGVAGWKPIGSGANPFTGNFDGSGYKIIGLHISNPSLPAVGLFSYIEGGIVKNIGLENVSISSTYSGVGGVVGQVGINGSITNCYVTGNINGTYAVGGVVGQVGINGCITSCYSTTNVHSDGQFVGGVAGEVQGSLANCYATGGVNGDGCVGGVAGLVNAGANVTNCYASGAISGNFSIGGVVGYDDSNNVCISNCVALNPSITYGAGGNDRVLGYNEKQGIITLSNNWANSAMILNGPTIEVNKGNNTEGGADCDAIPAASWWTTPAPNGPGWDSSVWYFEDGKLPILQWQR